MSTYGDRTEYDVVCAITDLEFIRGLLWPGRYSAWNTDPGAWVQPIDAGITLQGDLRCSLHMLISVLISLPAVCMNSAG